MTGKIRGKTKSGAMGGRLQESPAASCLQVDGYGGMNLG